MTTLTLKQSYQYYIKDMSVFSKYHISYDLYRKVCQEANKLIMSDITSGTTVALPYRLGHLRAKKHKINYKNLKPDFGLYNKEGHKNKHLNEHSGGYYALFYWDKRVMNIKNKTGYSFIPTRHHRRALASYIKADRNNINNFFE